MPPKKGKGEDKKAAADDVFDTVAVETKNALTAILMLDSPEDAVQARACEGIYKFACKCDDNRKTLLEGGAIDGLIKLLTVEDKTIKRNALMALGTMTHNQEVRRRLRANEDAIPTFLKLLNPDEFVTTHEFAALALSNMAKEFSSIPVIVENKGMELLLEAMKEEDPDVQKNSVECLSQLMRDFEAKSSVKDSSGLEALMQLLESEYAVIQQLALQSLIRATEDSVNRAALREIDALRVFVNLIGKPDFNDLHVLALHVISNCADDQESLVQLKENGGLPRLVAFIADETAPPEETPEAKGKDGKGKGPAKGKGSAKKKKGEDDTKDVDTAPPQTQSEVKMHAARAIGRAARTNEGKRILHDCNAERLLVRLLVHEDDRVRVAAAQAIAIMGENFLCQDAVLNSGGLDALVKMMRLENRDLKESSSLAIANLTTGNLPICSIVASANHGLDNLLGCLAHESDRVVSNGLTTLINMADDDELRIRILNQGLIAALLAPLASKSTLAQHKAALAVTSFVREADHRAEFRSSGALAMLVPLLTSTADDVRRAAAWASSQLLVDHDTSVEFYQLGGLEIIQALNASENKRSRFTEAAEAGLLSNNLSLKYALSGKLDVTDRVPDLFYDVGTLRAGEKLAPLESYCAQPVNTKRPILLINAHSEQSQSKWPEDENLRHCISEARELVAQCSNPREQILLLAKLVSDRMGGQIEPGQLMKFSFELPISQLKYNLKSNVIPLGLIATGIHYHRALLFKFLADKAGINCSLVRGPLNRAWNEVWLADSDGTRKYPPSEYVIDLIYQPGKLYRHDTIEAANYKKS